MERAWVKVLRSDGEGIGEAVYNDGNYADVVGIIGTPFRTPTGPTTFKTLDRDFDVTWEHTQVIEKLEGNAGGDPVLVTLEPAIPIGAPAADRVVTLDHNSRDYARATEAVVRATEALRGDNEYVDADDRDQRVAELEAGSRLLRAVRVRLDAIEVLLIAALKYLAKKFAEQAIGVLASAAIAALLALLRAF